MKYMIPELLARFQTTDDGEAESVAEQWDRQCKAYGKRLKAIRADLDPKVRWFLRQYRLHDAKMLAMTADKKGVFSIFIDLGRAREAKDRYVELRYRLASEGGPGFAFVHHDALSGHGKAFAQWLYDEMDVTAGPAKAMTHAILLTGGWELQLTFSRLRVRRLAFALPAADAEEVMQWVRQPA